MTDVFNHKTKENILVSPMHVISYAYAVTDLGDARGIIAPLLAISGHAKEWMFCHSYKNTTTH